ncbi:glycosyl hydrolase family 71-domain-containing protein [Aspergillus granulosus]|uniref:Glycosyl hydrolase family 71-domain-containing protein n=1 Tax=Aspergillus granulosus TaxID=176169 RepID=A0ABR4HRD5_9EURO
MMSPSQPWTRARAIMWTQLQSLPLLALLLSSLFSPCTQSKAVFAHFMVANTQNYTLDTWKYDIGLAQASSIDAFALNAGYGMRHTPRALRDAFDAAEELNFKLLFSFDYTGDGHWPKDKVVDILTNYTTHPAYYRHTDGRALVTTFEGFQSAAEWSDIKKTVGKQTANATSTDTAGAGCCFFIPDWSSVGPQRAAAIDAIDGLMSWDAWPEGAHPMNTTVDEHWLDVLNGRPYIMPVSPWFYTNLKRFNKNWVWRGDDLWYDRWQQVLELNPDYVEIITWNDYGESHYIGPLVKGATGVLAQAGAPFDYVRDMPHDGWRVALPYLIAQYKAGNNEEERSAVRPDEETLSVWYRPSHAESCLSGKTTGNSETQRQTLMEPGEVLEDKVFYSALLDTHADVKVSIGGVSQSTEWTDVPRSGRGVYHGSVAMGGRTGEVIVTLERGGEFLAQMKGRDIATECPGNMTNWNAWVGNATAVRRNRPPTAEGVVGWDESAAGLAVPPGIGGVVWAVVFALLCSTCT